MKYIFLILLSFSSLISDDFPYLQPISVEKPSQKTTTTTLKQSSEQEVKTVQTTQKKAIKVIDKRVDTDKDGVFDDQDKCPETSKEFIVDNNGCPKTSILDIKFDVKEYNLTDENFMKLENFADFLKKNKNYQVIIYGYTDTIGHKPDNKELSQKRADSVKEGLILHGISATKLTAIGKGEENPIADNRYKAGREKNRRIEVDLIQ